MILERDSEINELVLLRDKEIIKLSLKTTRSHLLQWTENDISCCLDSANSTIWIKWRIISLFCVYDQDVFVFLIRKTIFSVFLSELEIQPDVAYEKQYAIVIKFTLVEFSPVELSVSSATRGPIT